MNLVKLEKANVILQDIKRLDGEIIEIEKHALLIANGETEISLTLDIKDLVAKEKETSGVKFDEDGSIIINTPESSEDMFSKMMRQHYIRYSTITIPSAKTNEHKYISIIKENAALQILGVLLYVKQLERENNIKRLQKMGVDI